MINEKIKGFIESPVSNDFGLSIDTIADKCRTYGRFRTWLNQDINQIKQVLNIVKRAGLSPAFFASYERTEGYNSSWGWLNHTVQKGSYFQDATSVSNVVITQSNNMSGIPSWIDYGNPVDFVPSSVKSEGNSHFSTLAKGTIGRALIPLTAAATWEVYYPNGLLREYNRIQNYARPINLMVDTIIAWGGTITDEVPDPQEPEAPEVPDETPTGIDVLYLFNDLRKYIQESLNADVVKTGEFYQNNHIRLIKQYDNTFKVQMNTPFKNAFQSIFNRFMDSYIPDKLEPTPEPDPEPDPPSVEMFFPVRNQNGVNFWKRANWGVGTLQRNMTYGARSNGGWHYGYDIGGGNNSPKPIYSVKSGTVKKAGYMGGLGNYVTIQQDDYFVEYGHLASYSVSVGDSVKAGEQIGTMGATGGNYAVHLDIKISTQVNGFYAPETTIDPEKYLKVTADNVTTLPNP